MVPKWDNWPNSSMECFMYLTNLYYGESNQVQGDNRTQTTENLQVCPRQQFWVAPDFTKLSKIIKFKLITFWFAWKVDTHHDHILEYSQSRQPHNSGDSTTYLLGLLATSNEFPCHLTEPFETWNSTWEG